MKIAIELTAAEASLLQKRAKRLGVLPEEFVHSVVSSALSEEAERFAAAAEGVLRDHAELYKRLA